ncbi:MAG: hypothetical protein ACRDTV_06210 [Mycobacterium sp.]
MNAAAANAGSAWRANHPDAGYLLALLPAEDRHATLAALGYRRPGHNEAGHDDRRTANTGPPVIPRWFDESRRSIMSRIIAAAAAALTGLAVLTAPATATAAPTCMPGDEMRQGYQCSPSAGAGIIPGHDCIQVWRSYPSPMHLETICRGPR